jgi:hypothetical protein
MFDRLSTSLRAQLDGMFDVIAATERCMSGLRGPDYETFAGGYDGSGQIAAHAARLRAADAACRRLVEGRRFA